MSKRLLWSLLGSAIPFVIFAADKIGGDGLAFAVGISAFLGPWLWIAPWWKE